MTNRLFRAIGAQLGHKDRTDRIERADDVATDPLRKLMVDAEALHGAQRRAFLQTNRVALYDAWVRSASVESMVKLVVWLGVDGMTRDRVLEAAGMDPTLSDEEVVAEAFAIGLSSMTGEQGEIAERIRAAVPNPLG